MSPEGKHIFPGSQVSGHLQLVHDSPLEVGDAGRVDVGAVAKKIRYHAVLVTSDVLN